MTNLSVASWNRNIFVFCLTWTLLCYPNFPRTTVVCTSPFLQKKKTEDFCAIDLFWLQTNSLRKFVHAGDVGTIVASDQLFVCPWSWDYLTTMKQRGIYLTDNAITSLDVGCHCYLASDHAA
ncbi:hypothetical protein PR002_g9135 [Phytophthora rubi]|uniref:Uncharacterized protein n=1 Tax=Phytophthora rubi TaxID=129364 RepID=A0A6A3MTE4_9STRA|nr:hypothetical protein PR002_g9135 [Phytophthora rubi]